MDKNGEWQGFICYQMKSWLRCTEMRYHPIRAEMQRPEPPHAKLNIG
jgi:hypothetical protein